MVRDPPSVHSPGVTEPSSFNGIRLDILDASAPAPHVGESGSYTAVLSNEYGESGPSAELDPMNRYRRFEELSIHAGKFTTHELDDGRVQFIDETPPSWEYDLLVRLETPTESTAASRYGLLEEVNHGVIVPDGPVEVEFDLVYLAPLSEYRTKDALRQDLEAPGL